MSTAVFVGEMIEAGEDMENKEIGEKLNLPKKQLASDVSIFFYEREQRRVDRLS